MPPALEVATHLVPVSQFVGGENEDQWQRIVSTHASLALRSDCPTRSDTWPLSKPVWCSYRD
jgi:hypothetical protein